MDDDMGGVWRTIGGRRVFIKNGQSLSDAMKESGKFRNLKLKDNYNIETSEKFDAKIDKKIGQEVMEYTSQLYKEYADILPERKIVWGTFVTDKNVIANAAYNLNPQLCNNYDNMIELIKHHQETGYMAKTDNPIKQIVAHEVGHNIQTQLYRKLTTDSIKTQEGADKYTKKIMKQVVKQFQKENPGIYISDAVSEYGARNYYELFSEAFAEYTSSSKPREFAKIFGIIFEAERKKIK